MSFLTVRLEDVPSIPLAVIRRRASAAELSKVVPECCGLVWNVLRAQQAKGGRHVAVYRNADIRLEVGVEIEGPFVEQASVVRSATPAGKVAVVTYFGPYAGLGDAHDAVHNWARSEGYGLAGPNWEIYGHWQDAWNANPALIRTDVFYQIATS
jgi:effector-binding domain-containing protein